ncbi:MAG TPA: MarR family transcriptional regulator [Thermoleophilaceae bacterium]|nr:MarR family transcriptional regulator [Thermoleophilaceae bacterium]
MKTRAATATEIDELAHALPERIWLLGRLFWRRGQRDITRTEAGLLNSLSDGPRRITELAELEGLAQPTVTLLVGRLEERGWVTRERDPDDRRAVLVSHTPSGLTALEQMRSESRIMMHEHLSALEENEVHSLVAANDALAALVEQIQQGS